MRCRPLLALVLVLGMATGAYAADFTTNSMQEVIDAKDAALTGNAAYDNGLVGGEDIANAVNIPGLPYNDTGNTCGFADDYLEECPFTGAGAGDVVYKYTPTANEQITVDLCPSGYDSKVFIYENVATPGAPYACNDDADCALIFRSRLDCIPLTAGNTYYIVVDGYAADCGDYDMTVSLSVGCPAPCDPTCPEGTPTIAEGEVVCFDGYDDTYNSGCNHPTTPLKVLPCANSLIVCGTAGDYIFQGFSYRDTDWYEINLPASATVTATLCASFNSQLALLDGNLACAPVTLVCGSVFGTPNFTSSCTATFGPGKLWIFVADSDFFGWPCGSPYTLTVTGACPPTSTQTTTWGGIKGLYR